MRSTTRWTARVAAVSGATAMIGAFSTVAGAAPSATGRQVIAAGVVASAGKVVAGSPVYLYEMPTMKVMSSLRPGQNVPWKLVASGVSGSDGRYSLSVDPADLIGDASDGLVNLEAISPAGSEFDFSRRVVRTGGNLRIIDALTDTPVTGSSASASPAVVNLALHPDAIGIPGFHDEGPGVADRPDACFDTYQKSLGQVLTIVGQAYATTTGITDHFVYSQGATSSLGVGVSYNEGKVGSFSASGTSSTSTSKSQSFPSFGADKYVYDKTYFALGLYAAGCNGGKSWSAAQVSGWNGGGPYEYVSSAPSASDCEPEYAGEQFDENKTSAVDWSDGIDSQSLIGIDLSSQTGYSSSSDQTFTFSATRQLCGTSGYPGGTPRQLVAKS